MSNPRKFEACELQHAGLLPFHYQFAQRYFKEDSARTWLFSSPTGSGKATFGAFFVSQVASSATETLPVLVLAPAVAPLLDQWRYKITKLDTSVQTLIVDRKKFLELDADSVYSGQLWPPNSVIVMSINLAKRSDVRVALTASVWSLVVFDEIPLANGQNRQLIQSLISEHCCRRGLLLTSTHEPVFEGIENFQVKKEDIIDWNGKPVFSLFHTKICSAGYHRTDGEIEFLKRVEQVGDQITQAFPSGYLQWEMLLRSVSSSVYSVETTLRRLLDGWRPLRNKLAHGINPTPDDIDSITSLIVHTVDEADVEPDYPSSALSDQGCFLEAFSAVNSLIESIDEVSEDSKLGALIRHLGTESSSRSEYICICTSFVATGDYLSVNLDSRGSRVWYINGSVDTETQAGKWEQFEKFGGIAVVTEVSLQGVNLGFIDECISYDLPITYDQFEQRLGHFSRQRNKKPFLMTIINDLGGSFDWEEQLFKRVFTDLSIKACQEANQTV